MKMTGILLAKTIKERAEHCPVHLQLAEYGKVSLDLASCQKQKILKHYQENGIIKNTQPIQIKRPRCWKLATAPDDQSNQEELVLRPQGIICDRNLPPVKRPQTM